MPGTARASNGRYRCMPSIAGRNNSVILTRLARERSLRLVAQDTALSRREHEFESRREHHLFMRSSVIAAAGATGGGLQSSPTCEDQKRPSMATLFMKTTEDRQ